MRACQDGPDWPFSAQAKPQGKALLAGCLRGIEPSSAADFWWSAIVKECCFPAAAPAQLPSDEPLSEHNMLHQAIVSCLLQEGLGSSFSVLLNSDQAELSRFRGFLPNSALF